MDSLSAISIDTFNMWTSYMILLFLDGRPGVIQGSRFSFEFALVYLTEEPFFLYTAALATGSMRSPWLTDFS